MLLNEAKRGMKTEKPRKDAATNRGTRESQRMQQIPPNVQSHNAISGAPIGRPKTSERVASQWA